MNVHTGDAATPGTDTFTDRLGLAAATAPTGPHASTSLARRRTVRFRLPFLAGAVLGLAVSVVAVDAGLHVGQDTEAMVAEARGDTAADLVHRHGCWTGEAPADMAGVIPGHVVVSVQGEVRYAGERMVGKALEQIFDGVGHGLTVHGFCR